MLDILSAATWRLSYMVTREAGPLNVFAQLRAAYPALGDGGVGDVLGCQYCASVWCGFLVVALWFSPFRSVVYALAASGKAMQDAAFTGVGVMD